MKKLVVIGLAIAVGFALGRMVEDSPAHAGGGDPEILPCEGALNGDVNAGLGAIERGRTITDVVSLANFLFLGGDPPCDNTAGLVTQAELDVSETALAACQKELTATESALTLCQDELAKANPSLAACVEELGATQAELQRVIEERDLQEAAVRAVLEECEALRIYCQY